MPRIFTFSVRTIIGDTAEARAKAWRDLETIMREAVWYFTAAEVKALLKKITTRPKRGRPSTASWIKERLLEEYDAALRDAAPKRVNKAEFSRGFYKKHKSQYRLHGPEAVLKQLNRLLRNRLRVLARQKSGQN